MKPRYSPTLDPDYWQTGMNELEDLSEDHDEWWEGF